MISNILSVGISILFAWALFTNDEDVIEQLPEPEKKKQYIKVKRNGQWVDEEIKE